MPNGRTGGLFSGGWVSAFMSCATLAENDLEERETICEVSSVVVANRSQFKLRRAEVEPLIERLRAVAAAAR